jgi:serine/threonine protein kinase
VALKIVKTNYELLASSLKEEASIISNLPGSKNIIQYRNFHEFSNVLILALEYASGGTL